MASLLNRKGLWYLCWWEDGRQRRRSLGIKATGHKARKQAEELKEEFEDRLYRQRLGIPLEKKDITPEQAWDCYESAVVKGKNTLDGERIFWNQFWAWSQLPTLGSVRQADVIRWQKYLLTHGGGTELSKPNKPVSVNDKVRQVGTVYEWLIRLEEYIGENPFKQVKPLKEEKEKVKFVPWGNIKKLIATAQGHSRNIHLVFILGAYAGLRKNEILLQKWNHIDWDKKILHVYGTKTQSSSAPFPLHADLYEALLPYRGKGKEFIVKPENKLSSAKYRWEFSSQWRTVIKKAGIGHASPHMLRHSLATHLLDLGYSLADIAVILRHRSLAATKIYADLQGVTVNLDRL